MTGRAWRPPVYDVHPSDQAIREAAERGREAEADPGYRSSMESGRDLMTRKLVRDKISAIIRASGGQPVTRTASGPEYRDLLRQKLAEETREAGAADDDAHVPEELADVLEVVRALGADLGLTPGELERIRAAKAAERGGFAARVIWYPGADPLSDYWSSIEFDRDLMAKEGCPRGAAEQLALQHAREQANREAGQ